MNKIRRLIKFLLYIIYMSRDKLLCKTQNANFEIYENIQGAIIKLNIKSLIIHMQEVKKNLSFLRDSIFHRFIAIISRVSGVSHSVI